MTTSSKMIHPSRFPAWVFLFTNHADAWVTTLGISTAALIIHDRLTPDHFLLSLTIGIGYWVGFAINDFFDVDVDRNDPTKRFKNFFVRVPIKKSHFMMAFATLFILFLPIFLQYGGRGLIVVAVSFVVMWAYSAPPLRLKIRPLWDLFAHAFFVQTFPYAATVFLVQADWLPIDTVLILLGLLTSSSAQIEQQIRDADQDAQIGSTFALMIGPPKALYLLKILTALLLGFGLYHIWIGTIPLLIAPLGLITIPAVIPRFWRKVNQPRPETLIRFIILIGILYITFLVVWFLSS